MKLQLPRPRYIVILLCLVALLVVTPLVQTRAGTAMSRALGAFALVVPVLAVLATGGSRLHRRIIIGLALAVLVLSTDAMLRVSSLPPELAVATSCAFLGFATLRMFLGVLRTEKATSDVIAGALASYLMAGLTWALGYGLLEMLEPGSIQVAAAGGARPDFPTLIYFSFVTALSIGFGDVIPVSAPARTLAMFEGLFGMAFTTIVLAALVATYLSERRR